MTNSTYQHWRLETDHQQITWLWFDKKDSSTNTIDRPVLEELDKILDTIQQNPNTQGIVIGSAKTNGFIAGANIEQFTKLKSAEEAVDLIRQGQRIFDKLAAFSLPTVAMINGFCLGGGLELALACRYRVAENDNKTKLGLPEILLGIHPGWGGTIRLPQLIGPLAALDLILTGRTVSPNNAAKLGFVDAAVPKRHLQRAASHFILQKPPVRKATFLQSLPNVSFIRPLIGKLLYKKIGQKARQAHYPAPYAVIHNWIHDGAANTAIAMENEAKSIGQLIVSETAQNLVRIFFLQERLKGLAKGQPFKAKQVHVIGAGVMGGDIAAWCSLRGLKVTLQDRDPKFIAGAIQRAYELFKNKLKVPRLIQAAMDRLIPDLEGHGIPQADVIIEAISENPQAKQQLFIALEKKCKPEAILATNTSSIPLATLNQVLQNPKRLVGIHFFNPVSKMPLIEIVHDTDTDQQLVQQAIAFARQIDRLPLPVKSAPGFLVNRILMPYMVEAFMLLHEGTTASEIDAAALAFGMPMGPLELADTVGLDVCLSVAKFLAMHQNKSAKDTQNQAALDKLETMVAIGQLGRKTGKGFYTYQKGKRVKENTNQLATVKEDNLISQRLILRMLNEAAACLSEHVVSDMDLLDAGIIFGTGFAPFRGGPMHYAKKKGFAQIATQLQHLQNQFGERFKPETIWLQLQ